MTPPVGVHGVQPLLELLLVRGRVFLVLLDMELVLVGLGVSVDVLLSLMVDGLVEVLHDLGVVVDVMLMQVVVMEMLAMEVVHVSQMLMVVVAVEDLLFLGVVVVKGDVFVVVVDHGLVLVMFLPSVLVVVVVLHVFRPVRKGVVSLRLHVNRRVILVLHPSPPTVLVTVTPFQSSAVAPSPVVTVLNPVMLKPLMAMLESAVTVAPKVTPTVAEVGTCGRGLVICSRVGRLLGRL
jgi:hypothetical protein